MSLPRRKLQSAGAQKLRMGLRWPEFERRDLRNGLAWSGPIRGFQRFYQISIVWQHKARIPPRVFVLEPKLCPRPGGDFTHIPHLIFNEQEPADSALCLYDPEGREWNATMLIADTIVPWASEWLHHYELWHFDGVWHGPNAPGPISVAEMRAQNAEEG